MSGLFKTPKLPTVADPTPLPDEDATTAARRRKISSEQKKSGVASTILSSGSRETLGA